MIEREEVLATSHRQGSSGIALPSAEWSIGVEKTSIVYPVGSQQPEPQPPFPSRFAYTRQQIDEAQTFAKDILRPFVKTLQTNTSGHGARLEYLYPTHNQSPSMSTDQWKPFAVWMQQNRLRALQEAPNAPPCKQLMMVVSGEGGTGKSWLIKHIIEDLRVVVGYGAAKRKVMLMAHQGSAAFLIGGRTLSSCLALACHGGANFNKRYVPLTSTGGGQTSLRRIQNECEHLQSVVIDEFGVVSCGMLHWIDQRFREIFPTHRDKPFGGRDMLFTGDPGQLRPIRPSPLATPLLSLANDSEQKGRQLGEYRQLLCPGATKSRYF